MSVGVGGEVAGLVGDKGVGHEEGDGLAGIEGQWVEVAGAAPVGPGLHVVAVAAQGGGGVGGGGEPVEGLGLGQAPAGFIVEIGAGVGVGGARGYQVGAVEAAGEEVPGGRGAGGAGGVG